MQRALLQGTLEYLWGSSDQGGLREAGGFAVLPTALLRHLPDAETHNPPASLPSLPRTSTCSNSPSKRARLDEGSSLAAFSTDDAEGAAGARGSPAGTPLTEVTLDGDYHAESDLKKPANSLEVHASNGGSLPGRGGNGHGGRRFTEPVQRIQRIPSERAE